MPSSSTALQARQVKNDGGDGGSDGLVVGDNTSQTAKKCYLMKNELLQVGGMVGGWIN